MSDVITATRQIIQDLITPEMREVKARIDDLGKRVDEGFRRADANFADMREQLSSHKEYIELRERMARMETMNEVLLQRLSEVSTRSAAH
jgi:hypothetical protein